MKKEDIILKMLEEHIDSSDKRLDSIDDNLREHMRRTDVLEDLHMDNQARIAKLEAPAKALLFIKNVVLYIAAITGAIIALLKLGGK